MPSRLLVDERESYRFLAATLAPPTQDLVVLLRRDPELPGAGEWVADYPAGRLLYTLKEEHTRLFVNAFPQLAALPYAAFYLDPERPDRLLTKIEERLTSFGLVPNYSVRERLDHVRSLLEAAGHIPNQKALADFVREFILPWFSSYRIRLSEAVKLPLYSGLIEAAGELVASSAKKA